MRRCPALVSLLAAMCVAGCVNFGPPPGLPHGTAAERLRTFARLLRMEDERRYDPLLTGRAAVSPDPWLRAKTALAAGRLHDPEASPYLPVFLRDPESSVRRAAAFGAGLSGDRRLLRFLFKALADPDAETASNAAEALGKLGGDEAVSALMTALREETGPRAAAALALYRFPDKRVVASLLSTFEEERLALDVRRAVVYALSRRPQPEAAAALRAVLRRGTKREEDPGDDAETVAYAARGLGLLKDEGAIRSLTELAASADVSVAVQSLSSLQRIDGAGGNGTLAALVREVALRRAEDVVPGVAVAALGLLGRFPGDAEVAARLEADVLRKGWKGQTSLVSLARVDPARAERAITALLGEGTESARRAPLELRLGVVEALEFLEAKSARQLLERLLNDPSARVRAAAVSCLSRRTGDRPEAWLVDALGDSDAAVRAAALEAVAPLLDDSSPQGSLRQAWARAYDASFRQKEPDFIVSALDAAAALKIGGRELVLAHADDSEAVARGKARRLLVEKFGAKPEDFGPMPVKTRFRLPDYESFARTALESLFSAEVVTPRGRFTIELDVENAPLTVLNFVRLARQGFFDGGIIHRVVPDFVIQGGDPRGDGSGGPLYVIRDEINMLRTRRGAAGMALSGADTGGSQWFVTLSPQPHLEGGYTVFGRVAPGMDVVDRMEQDDALVSVRIIERARPAPPPGALP